MKLRRNPLGGVFKTVSVSSMLAFFLIAIFIFGCSKIILAEQQGTTPESGATSHLKSLADDLSGLSFGTTTNDPDWGTMWNRISTAAKWTPSGTVTASDVAVGKTYYAGNRTAKTGTYQVATSCPTQTNYDSYTDSTTTTNCSLTWVTPSSSVTGDDKQDPRTGLVWSKPLKNNSGTIGFDASSPSTWSWTAAGTNNVAVGNKTAIQLCSSLGNGWYLPSEKDYMQGYIDGMYYNLTGLLDSVYWGSTSGTGATAAGIGTYGGSVGFADNSTAFYVLCVRQL